MTIWNRRIALFVLALACGCSRQDEAPKPAEAPEVVVAAPATGPEQPKPPELPVQATFEFTPDLTGETIAKALEPDVSRPLPVVRFGQSPRPHTVPRAVFEPMPLARTSFDSPTVLPTPHSSAWPDDPPEAPPLSLGFGADALPAKPVLPVAAVETPPARDVNLPPPAPKLGRKASARVPFDDPTGELGDATVVGGPVKAPLPGVFPKAAAPGPSEFGAQVKPNVPAGAVPSAAPVEVNPPRAK